MTQNIVEVGWDESYPARIGIPYGLYKNEIFKMALKSVEKYTIEIRLLKIMSFQIVYEANYFHSFLREAWKR